MSRAQPMGRSLILALAAAALCATAAPAAAEMRRPRPPPAPQPASWRLVLSDLTVLRANPTGLETRVRFGLQKRLYESERPVAANNFGFAGLYSRLNPASAHLALGGELQPMSMFNLRASAEVQRYFGTFGFLQSFASPNANYSDATLDDRADSARGATSFRVGIQPTVQARVGPISIRAQLQLDYWALRLRGGDTVAYEATHDTLLPDGGWTLATDTDLLYTGRPRLAVGIRHTHVHPFYGSEHFTDAADEAAYAHTNKHQRIGLFAAYSLFDHRPSRFNKPTLILIAAWYLDHRYRAGAPAELPADGRAADYRSRAVPYLLAGFAFESDFLPARY